MSYILTGKSNPAFNLRALITAPMLQSAIVCKLTAERKVDLVLRYEGVRPSTELHEAADNDRDAQRLVNGMSSDHPGTHQQVAVFNVIESYNAQVKANYTFYVPLTDTTLEHALFAFIPQFIQEVKDEPVDAEE